MKATGIVRRIDDLGRVVVPKEIRRNLHIREGDPLEIFVDNGAVCYKKYSPIGTIGMFAEQYAETLSKVTGLSVCITDRDNIIAVSGKPKRELIEKRVSNALEKVMEDRTMFVAEASDKSVPMVDGLNNYAAGLVSPIIFEGDIIGSVVFLNDAGKGKIGDVEITLARSASDFLGKITT